jgi:tRNA (guanine-N7-)-methyltransferase
LLRGKTDFATVIQSISKTEGDLKSYLARLDLRQTFGRVAPLQVDLGCGEGSFVCELGERHPEKNFLGIERLASRVGKTFRKAARIDNVRVLHAETSYAVRYLLPERSVETFYLLFPDPWPKRRHHRRRIFTPAFLKSVHAALNGDGVLRIATDHHDYFTYIQRLAGQSTDFAMTEMNGQFPASTFEKRFQRRGVTIYRLTLRKISPVT